MEKPQGIFADGQEQHDRFFTIKNMDGSDQPVFTELAIYRDDESGGLI